MVLKKKGELLYNRVQDFIREWLSRQVLPQVQHLLSGNLLVDPQLGLGATANERRIAGERFLKGLKQAWQDHQVCMRMLTDVLMYMVNGHLSYEDLLLSIARTEPTVKITKGHPST